MGGTIYKLVAVENETNREGRETQLPYQVTRIISVSM